MTTSYRTLNQIFYTNNKFDVPESIHLLEPFFYSGKPAEITVPIIDEEKKTLPTLPTETVSESKKTQDKVPTVKNDSVGNLEQVSLESMEIKLDKKMDIFVPTFSDTIFWSIFNHVYGEIEYKMIASRYGNRILEEKKKIMEHFHKSPKSMKSSNTKFTNDRIQETISELICAKNCSSFLETSAYALYYNLTIYIIDEKKRTYLVFKNKDQSSDNICILYANSSVNLKENRLGIQQRKYYSLLKDPAAFNMSILDTYVQLEQFDKPLKAQTHYKKMAELEEIAERLGLEYDKKLKKAELYILLAQRTAWL